MVLIKILSVAFITGGVLLFIFGIDAWNSVGSEISELFQGGPSNRAILLLVSGIVAFVIGLGGLFYNPRVRTQ